MSRSLLAKVPILISLLLTPVLISPSPIHAQLEDLVARVKQAVVLVQVRSALDGTEGRGSGFVYHPSGYILTSRHVVEGTVDISVKTPDGRSFPAQVIDCLGQKNYSDGELESITDAAVIKINASGLPTLLLESRSEALRQGQELLVFGYPEGVAADQVSVTRGIVSAIRTGWIQTDAAMEPGYSGGPVVDRQGRVVGLATFVTGPLQKIGGAVATSSIRRFAEEALDPNATRRQQVDIPGLEYVSPRVLPKKKTYRITYTPGTSGRQPYVREIDTSVTDIQDVNCAYIYTARDSAGNETKYYLGGDGVFRQAFFSPVPQLIFPLPPRVGQAWQGLVEFLVEHRIPLGVAMGGISPAEWRIESVGDVVTTPAGTFSRTVKIAGHDIFSRAAFTFWYAPQVGQIKVVTQVAETSEELIRELVSTR